MSLFRWIMMAIVAVAVIAAVGVTYEQEPAQAEPQAKQEIPEVEVVTITPQEKRVWSEFSGRLAAVDFVEIKPRVSGRIEKILFEEGSLVQKGDPLYVIDPRPFEAEVASAKAALESARSRAALAKVELKRAEGLVKESFVSKSRYDEAHNDYKVALADIDAAKARLEKAKLDLEFAHIEAPVNGRISRAEITEGNVIEAGLNAPVLTTIVSNDRLFAEFDIDERTYVEMVRRQASGGKMPVELSLSSDNSVAYSGHIHSFDNRLDTASGTIRARAIVENKDDVLVPGMYVNVRLGSASEESLLLVSERSIGTDQDKRFVYVVTEENKVAYRRVRLGRSVDGSRVVLSGLEPGERVLVNSLQRVRPEMQVTPVEVSQASQRHSVAR